MTQHTFRLFNNTLYVEVITPSCCMAPVLPSFYQNHLPKEVIKGEIVNPLDLASFDMYGTKIVSVYLDNDKGTKQANEYMSQNQNTGVYLVNYGYIFIAEIKGK